MRQDKERINGPYKHGARYRLVVTDAAGNRSYPSEGESGPQGFATRAAALEYKAAWLGEDGGGHTLTSAIDAYLKQRTVKAGTVTTERYRLHALLDAVDHDRRLLALDAELGRELFAARVAAGITPDTQHGELATARRFAAWCVAQGWLDGDPFAKLVPTGERARGKAQLRIDESRRFVDVALGEGSEAGLAATMALLMDLRASEIVGRLVRDVDDDVRVLWVGRAKTRAGDRKLEIPGVLRDQLAARIKGRSAGELLFPGRSRHWVGYHVRRLCDAADVPVVCPHGLRGTHSSISVREVPIEHVAAAMGHASPAVTRRHYLAPGAEQDGRQRAVLRVVQGGRR